MPPIIGLELKCTNQEEIGVGNDISALEGEESLSIYADKKGSLKGAVPFKLKA